MITEQEAREAASRLREMVEDRDAGEFGEVTALRVYGTADMELAGSLGRSDVDKVVRWLLAELPRREAERAERAKPIDAEWLKSVGAKKRAINRWRLCDQCNLWLRENCLWTVRVDGYTVVVTTRGQLLDLIAALKGGAT